MFLIFCRILSGLCSLHITVSVSLSPSRLIASPLSGSQSGPYLPAHSSLCLKHRHGCSRWRSSTPTGAAPHYFLSKAFKNQLENLMARLVKKTTPQFVSSKLVPSHRCEAEYNVFLAETMILCFQARLNNYWKIVTERCCCVCKEILVVGVHLVTRLALAFKCFCSIFKTWLSAPTTHDNNAHAEDENSRSQPQHSWIKCSWLQQYHFGSDF